jgi:Protein of unknown function (DUF2778)
MIYRYEQSTGNFFDATGYVTRGYSGSGQGRNNAAMEDVPDVGPIPRGTYAIGEAETSDKLGPIAMPLTPLAGTDTHGRSGFFIHGDSFEHPGNASHGCVILPRFARSEIALLPDTHKVLNVA